MGWATGCLRSAFQSCLKTLAVLERGVTGETRSRCTSGIGFRLGPSLPIAPPPLVGLGCRRDREPFLGGDGGNRTARCCNPGKSLLRFLVITALVRTAEIPRCDAFVITRGVTPTAFLNCVTILTGPLSAARGVVARMPTHSRVTNTVLSFTFITLALPTLSPRQRCGDKSSACRIRQYARNVTHYALRGLERRRRSHGPYHAFGNF